MGNIYSSKIGDIKECWVLKITLSAGEQPLPNVTDFGRATIGVNYCLYNESEHKKKLPVTPDLHHMETLEKNSVIFEGEGAQQWKVSAQSPMPFEFPLTKSEYDEAYSVVIWADPFASAAFFSKGNWRGVLIIDKIAEYKNDESDGMVNKHVIDITVKVAQSVISYFLDLVETYTTPNFKPLKDLHDAIKENNDVDAMGKLGVMGVSIGANNSLYYATKNDIGDGIINPLDGDLYDKDYWISESKKAKDSSNVEWGESNISIYDFKAPINKLYGAMMRIGNDGRIYSNEGFSNLNWGIVGYQLEIGPDKMIEYAHMDITSGDQTHDDEATMDGQKGAEIAAKTSTEKPRALDRRALFLFTVNVISSNDLYTYVGVFKYQYAKKLQIEKERLMNGKRYR
ncbi:hypothetical protein DLR11_05695 [Salmonella enterica subsp. salamae]|uniref:Uncharacterized protein n=3 Tax=Salmonella enterica TaxID=28901 RepID=A0A379QMN6_SALER|nr:hypothetical protein [Salmonella enterica]ECC1480797.1 hypothetical protein [Salmonella enterica subsp. salamae]EHM1749725.1 hypothetical protein [Salmonella enterica subsp. salamae serovar 40:c:e,n,x,z15]HCM1999835.1 hypothetical protein [Salmonella enterica subsp. salamae serovar [1],40:z35:e,n,x,z15]ASG89026.1 hypothetical protein LFZ47_16455 [Salmonella enterica subsp. salamae serovar 55:k:z39 str. 1315K]ECC1655378.1 hypothetical protein [Salmonella enterica subsp. salamae]